MKITIDNTMEIGGHKIEIDLDPKLSRDNNGGLNELYQNKIHINPDRPSDMLDLALIHEVAHSINVVYCQNNLSEDEIRGMAEGMLQFIRSYLGIEFCWENIPISK